MGETGMRILIIGAGAIGGITGGYLARTGEDVTLVDRVEAHVHAMQANGLLIDGLPGELRVPVKAALPEELVGVYDLVLLAVKSQHTRDALPLVVQHLAPEGIGISLQNGLGNKPLLMEVIGAERTVGAMVRVGGGYQGPGHVRHLTHGLFIVGELDGRMTPRLETIRALLAHVEPTESSDNLYGWLWAKEVYGSFVVMTALVDATFAEVLDLPHGEELAIRAMSECARIARADGVRLERFDFLDPNALFSDTPEDRARTAQDLQAIRERFGEVKSGPWRDIVVRKIPIEVDYTLGEIVRIASRQGTPAPILERINQMMREIAAGERPMSPENIAELARIPALACPPFR
jgi:2-dehydropantoate 2-reductase